MKYEHITETIIGCSFEVHNRMGTGYLESVYENCMQNEWIDQHEVQLVHYLNATGKSVGLLINFGPGSADVRRKVKDLSDE